MPVRRFGGIASLGSMLSTSTARRDAELEADMGSYIVGPKSSQIVRTPKGVHGKRDMQQAASAGHNNVKGQQHFPAHSS
jgi:hypothetical protein